MLARCWLVITQGMFLSDWYHLYRLSPATRVHTAYAKEVNPGPQNSTRRAVVTAASDTLDPLDPPDRLGSSENTLNPLC